MTVEVPLRQKQQTTSAVPVLDRRMVAALLAITVVIGAVAGILRLVLGLGATTNLSDSYSWGIWIGFDFGLIALAGAGFTMAAVGHVLRRHEYHAAVRPAILAGLAAYVAVLLLLVLDLGRPDRFYNFMLFWNPHSPLFEVSWCILLYTGVLVLETSPFFLERLRWRWAGKVIRIVAFIMLPVAILGVTLSTLHQSTLGTLYLNMPYRLHALWYTPLLPLMFFTSAVMAGLSMGAIAYWVAGRVVHKPVQPRVIFGLARIAAVVGLFYLALKLGEVIIAGDIGLALAPTHYAALWWFELLVCVALPAALILLPGKTLQRTGIGLALIIFGVLMNRFDATMFAQILPPGASYSPSLIEWLSTAGILAAAALAWILGVRFLPIFETGEADHHATTE
ncbi:MAG: polysulfide reductase NrfD [Caldilineae bacterium]|nr:polysulfide reductase NrfD [Anaerolineae bacterium]MCB0203953.1 polysulfide reductase NrfD [Anaerolineae bacterium]MCB9152535.1 polysulfide reductase NrfD [Caldilineae bacterium]